METIDLNTIKTPADIRNMNLDQLKALATQIR